MWWYTRGGSCLHSHPSSGFFPKLLVNESVCRVYRILRDIRPSLIPGYSRKDNIGLKSLKKKDNGISVGNVTCIPPNLLS